MSMRVLAKFYLSTLTESKFPEGYETIDEDGKRKWAYKDVSGASLKMYGVQGEPFGSATPSASLDMAIKNPAAAAVFVEAYREWLNNPGSKMPEFYVTFERATEEHAKEHGE